MGKPHLQIILGSVRHGRRTAPLARWAAEQLRNSGTWTVEVIDLADWAFPQFALAPPAAGPYEDRLQRAWARTMRRGDAYVIAAPEYNHGYTGVLKTALDYLYAEWLYKPASILTFGNAEGARMTQALQQVLIELGMVPSAPAAHMRDAYRKIQGEAFASDERDLKTLGKMSNQLLQWRERLRNDAKPPGDGPRVLVVGGDERVLEPLQRAGVRVSAQDEDTQYDVISTGRGAYDKLRERHPKARFVDTIAPIAVRQIESELAILAGDEKRLMNATTAEMRGNALAVTIELSDASRVGITAYAQGQSKRLATLELAAGTTTLSLPVAKADNIVVDADGAEFRHHAVESVSHPKVDRLRSPTG